MLDLDFQPAMCGEVRAFAPTGVLGSAPTGIVESVAGEARTNRMGMRLATGDRVWGTDCAGLRMGMRRPTQPVAETREILGTRVGDADNHDDRSGEAVIMLGRVWGTAGTQSRVWGTARTTHRLGMRRALGTRMGDAGRTGEARAPRGENWGPHGGCGCRRQFKSSS